MNLEQKVAIPIPVQIPSKNKEVKSLKEKVNNMNQTLRMQILSTNKIDKIRQKLSNKVKILQTENESLLKDNTDYMSSINNLKIELENFHQVKLDGSQNEGERIILEKTQSTLNDKDNSHLNPPFFELNSPQVQGKRSFCHQHTQRIKELEKSNIQLE